MLLVTYRWINDICMNVSENIGIMRVNDQSLFDKVEHHQALLKIFKCNFFFIISEGSVVYH